MTLIPTKPRHVNVGDKIRLNVIGQRGPETRIVTVKEVEIKNKAYLIWMDDDDLADLPLHVSQRSLVDVVG